MAYSILTSALFNQARWPRPSLAPEMGYSSNKAWQRIRRASEGRLDSLAVKELRPLIHDETRLRLAEGLVAQDVRYPDAVGSTDHLSDHCKSVNSSLCYLLIRRVKMAPTSMPTQNPTVTDSNGDRFTRWAASSIKSSARL